MADISLKIKSDFEQAEKDFQSFKNSSESARKQIEKFQQSFKSEQIDKFTQRNKLAAAAATATGGKIAGMQREYSGLQREIQRLISKGMSPQDKELKRLISDYNKLQSEITQTTSKTQAQSSAFGSGIRNVAGYAAAYVSLRGALSAIKALTVGLAEQGDEAAKTSRRLGLTAEQLQEYKFAADRAGVSGEEVIKSFEKLNKNVGDLRGNYGSLNTILKATNPELLEQFKSVQTNEEAFKLATKAIGELPTQLEKASLAQALFGRSGLKMLTVMEGGTEEIEKLREEARKYGNIISNETAAASEEFIDAQLNMKSALRSLIITVGTPLLKPLTQAMTAFTEWATTGDNLKNTLTALGYIFSAIAGGIIAFKVASIAASIASGGFAVAVKVLTAAMATNPIGLIAVVITAVLIPAIIYLVKNFDKVKFHVIDFALVARQKMLELQLTIREKVMGAITEMLDKFRDLPVIGKMFGKISDYQKGYTEQIRNNIKAIEENRTTRKKAFDELMEQKQKEIDAAKAESNNILNNNNLINDSEANKAAKFKEVLKTMSNDRLKDYQKNLDAAKSFFGEKAELEAIDMEERERAQRRFFREQETSEWQHSKNKLKLLKQYLDEVKSNEKLNAKQREIIEKGLRENIKKEEQKLLESRTQFANLILTSTGKLLNSLQTIYENAGKKSRGLAIALKALAMAEAAINTSLAVTKTLAAFSWPFNLIAAGIVAAAGLAEEVAIATTKIPSAQTGLLDYTVPDTPRGRLDRSAVMASPGERVTVTPRSEDSSRDLSININVNEDNIFRVVQKGIDTGKISVNDNNIGRAVFA